MRLSRPVLLVCLLSILAAAIPAAAQDVPPPEPPRMAARLADHIHGPGAVVRVACSASCDIKGTLTIGYNIRVYLHLPSKTVGSGKGHLDGAGSIDVLVDLTNRVIRAVKKHHGNQLPVRLQATARDVDGRKASLTKNLKIPL